MAERALTPRTVLAALFLLAAAPQAADAASLQVSPVTLTRVAPAGAGSLSLTNSGSAPIDAQVRVLRWRQSGGADVLEATGAVVASPPILRLQPGRAQTVRIVRVSGEPVTGEESYRVLVDELPTRGKSSGDTVRLVIRYSLPVFFQSAGAARTAVTWSARYRGGVFVVTAQNSGTTRSQVAALELVDAGGTVFRLVDGLAGYVLGGSSMTWSLRSRDGRSPQPGPASLRYKSDGTLINAPIRLRVGG